MPKREASAILVALPAGERVPDAVVVEAAPELRLPDHAVQGLVIEDVCEVGEGA